MAQANNAQTLHIGHEATTSRRDDNVKDLFKILTVLAIIIVGYFEFVPERDAAREVAIVTEQVAMASAKK